MRGLGNGGGCKRREDTQGAARRHVRVPAGRCDSLVHAGNHLKLSSNEAAGGGQQQIMTLMYWSVRRLRAQPSF